MSSLSLAGSIFIIVIYFKLGMRTNFALKIIMYLTLGDALFSISNLIYIDPGMNYHIQVNHRTIFSVIYKHF